MRPVAAIDQGTSSTKLAILEGDGRIAVHLRQSHETSRPQLGWVEQDGEELLANIRRCLAAAEGAAAVGLSNQGESCLAWDRMTGAPLSPVIVWQDRRTESHIADLARDGGEHLTRERAGLPLDSYFSASKLGWLLASNSEVKRAYGEGRLRLGTTDAFFLERLTGQFVTDLATASRTSLLDIRSGEWDRDLCDLFGVPLECLPAIRPTLGDFGLADGIPVTASIVDQQASLYGHGCRASGEVKVTFGTGAFVLSVTGSSLVAAPQSGLLPTVAWLIADAPTYALEGGVFDAGGAVDWVRGLGLLQRIEDLSSFDEPAAISRGLAFVPALSGLGCPHWDRKAGGLWIGMTGATSAADLCQALVEGIALRVAEVLTAMADNVGAAPAIHVDGGLAASDYLLQFLADVAECEVVRPAFHDVTSLGTALLAAQGAGIEPGYRHDDSTVFTPNPADATLWRARFRDAVTRSGHWH